VKKGELVSEMDMEKNQKKIEELELLQNYWKYYQYS